jgi:hypothetical protein
MGVMKTITKGGNENDNKRLMKTITKGDSK